MNQKLKLLELNLELSEDYNMLQSPDPTLAPSDCLPYTNVVELSVIKGRSRLDPTHTEESFPNYRSQTFQYTYTSVRKGLFAKGYINIIQLTTSTSYFTEPSANSDVENLSICVSSK